MNKKRDHAIDLARGIAIALMVSANMAIISTNEPWWIFRFTSSLAAPIFITLTTMMAILGLNRGKGFSSALTKCLFLFVVAASLDTINTLLPVQNIDVLYIIGLFMIIISLVGMFSNRVLLSAALVVLLITPYLQFKFGYQQSMILMFNEVDYKTYLYNFIYELPHRYLIDGWFPLFPWLSVALFGAVLGKLRYGKGTIKSFATSSYLTACLLLLVIGSVVWVLYPGEQIIRYNYIELFYQPVPGFMLVAMGVSLGTICLLDYAGNHVSFLAGLRPLGEASLFMYLFHILVIDYVIVPFGTVPFGPYYALIFLILLGIMIAIGYMLRAMRAKPAYKKLPHFVKWIFG